MFNEEELKFIRETIQHHTFEETTFLFNERFNRRASISAIYRVCSVNKFKKVHPTVSNGVIQWLADFYYTTYPIMQRTLNYNKINPRELYKLLNSEDLINRRDEFYSLFKSETTADRLWVLIWENERREIKCC